MLRVPVVSHEGGWAVKHEGVDGPISPHDRCKVHGARHAARQATVAATG